MERTKNQAGPKSVVTEATGGSEAQGSTQQPCPRAALPSLRRKALLGGPRAMMVPHCPQLSRPLVHIRKCTPGMDAWPAQGMAERGWSWPHSATLGVCTQDSVIWYQI